MSFLVPFSSRFYRYFNTFLRFLPFFFYFLSSFFPFSYPVFSFFSVLAFTFTIDPFCYSLCSSSTFRRNFSSPKYRRIHKLQCSRAPTQKMTKNTITKVCSGKNSLRIVNTRMNRISAATGNSCISEAANGSISIR